MAPRSRETGSAGRQRGGIGLTGAGAPFVELHRRKFRARNSELEAELGFRTQMQVTRQVLDEIGAGDVPWSASPPDGAASQAA